MLYAWPGCGDSCVLVAGVGEHAAVERAVRFGGAGILLCDDEGVLKYVKGSLNNRSDIVDCAGSRGLNAVP